MPWDKLCLPFHEELFVIGVFLNEQFVLNNEHLQLWLFMNLAIFQWVYGWQLIYCRIFLLKLLENNDYAHNIQKTVTLVFNNIQIIKLIVNRNTKWHQHCWLFGRCSCFVWSPLANMLHFTDNHSIFHPSTSYIFKLLSIYIWLSLLLIRFFQATHITSKLTQKNNKFANEDHEGYTLVWPLFSSSSYVFCFVNYNTWISLI